MTDQEFVDKAKDTASRAYASESPDGDPLPMILVEVGDGGLHVFALDPGSMGTAWEKRLMYGAIAASAAEHQAQRVAVLLPSWKITTGPDDPPPPNDFSEDPRREEVMEIVVVLPASATSYGAPVLRREGQPPELGEWEVVEGVTGDAVEPFRRVLA